MHRVIPVALAALVTLNCSDSAAPLRAACTTPETVTITTTKTGNGLVIDWTPTCSVALVLVEDDGSDMWYAWAPNLDENSTEASNIINPAVTYGQLPPGTEGSDETLPLVAGQTYDIILWRVVPEGAPATCIQRFSNVCLIGQKQFTY